MSKTIRRRRREGKTDYKARFGMLKSEKPRIVVRKSNRYIVVQIAESDIAKDKIIVGVSSKDLIGKGWPKENSGSLKNLGAAYLTGFMAGKKATEKKIKEVILDIGLNRNVGGSRIYAAVAGAIDAGLKIPHNKEALPKMERINGNEKTKKIFTKVKENL